MKGRTIEQALRDGRLRLGGDSAGIDAQLLLGQATGRNRSSLFAWSDAVLTEAEEAQYAYLLDRRLAGEPVAYLIGTQEFWSLPLYVSPATLIPRSDTECLVEQALALELAADARVVDLGTGTGAIALALASERTQWQLWGTDRSADAVALAQRNSVNLGLERVRFLVSDWFSGLEGESFDLIVSNPPYIPEHDRHLNQGDLRYEPASALIAGTDGLDDLRVIVDQAPHSLAPGGWLLLEHGYDQAEAIAGLLAQRGFEAISLRYDYAGQPRITQGRWPVQSGDPMTAVNPDPGGEHPDEEHPGEEYPGEEYPGEEYPGEEYRGNG